MLLNRSDTPCLLYTSKPIRTEIRFEITLAGVGMGNPKSLTGEVKEAIEMCIRDSYIDIMNDCNYAVQLEAFTAEGIRT